MSKEIDEKVVEMRFDNSNFEKNVSQTMSTLDKLKASLKLDGATKSFEEIDKAASDVSFDRLVSSVEALQQRFSTFGIVGMRVIENITDSVMNLASKTTSFITSSIKTGGINRAMNLENANFQLQGLLKDEAAVEAVMQNVKDSVDGTAYSLDAAAKVASQLAASGMRAGDEMFSALRGAAGVAAMTNSEYEDIGRIYTQVAGQGRLMGDQLLQLSGRGMNAAATLAEYLNKTEAEVREMVSDGEISFATFAAAMDDAFGEHAKKANETLTGAFSNVKSAMARIGEIFVSPLIVQNGPLVELLNTIRVKINDIKGELSPLADLFTETVTKAANGLTKFISKLDVTSPFKKFDALASGNNSWEKISEKISATGITLDDLEDTIISTAKKMGISIDDIIDDAGSLEAALSGGKISGSVIVKALREFVDNATKVSSATSEVTNKIEDLQTVVNKVIRGDFGNGADRVKALTDAGYDYATVQDLVNKTLAGETVEYEKLTDAQLKNLGYTEEQITALRKLADEAEKTGTPLNELMEGLSKPSGTSLLIESLQNAVQGFAKILKSIGSAWSDVFSPITSDTLYSIIEKIHDFSSKLIISDKSAGNLRSTFKGLFSVVSIVGNALSALLKFVSPVTSVFAKLGSKVLAVTGRFGEWIAKLNDSVKKSDVFNKAVQKIIDFLKKLKDTAVRIGGEIKDGIDWSWLTTVRDKVVDLGDAIKNKLHLDKLGSLGDFVGKVNDSISKGLDGLSAQKFIDGFNRLVDAIKDGSINFDYVKDKIKGLKDGIGNNVENIGEQFETLGTGVKTLKDSGFSKVGDIFSRALDGIVDAMTRAKDFLTEHIDIGALATVGFGGAFIFLMKKIEDALEVIGKPFQTLDNFVGSITGIFNGVKGVLSSVSKAIEQFGKAEAFKVRAEGIYTIAKAIALLVGSLIALTLVDQNKLGIAAITLGSLAGGLLLLAAGFAAINKFGGSGASAGGLNTLALTASLLILVKALKQLQKMDTGDAWKSVGLLAALFVELVAAMAVLSKVSGSSTKDAATFVALALSLKILVGALEQLSELDLKSTWASMPILLLLMGGMVAVLAVSKGSNSGGGVGMLAIAASFLLIIQAIKMIGDVEPDVLAVGLVVIGLISTIYLAMIGALGLAGENSAKAGIGMLGIAASFILIAYAIEKLGEMDMGVLAKGTAAVTVIGVIFAGMIAATKLAGDNAAKAGVTLIAMSAAITLMTAAIYILGKMDSSALEQAIKAIAVIGVVFAGIIAVTALAKNCTKTLTIIAITIGALAASLALLSLCDSEGLQTATVALGVLMGMFAVMVASTAIAKKADSTIFLMAAVVGELAIILSALSKLNPDSVLMVSESLSLLMISMAASFALIGAAGKVSASTMGSMALLGLVVAEIAVILGVLDALNVTPSIETAASLSLMLVSMAAVMAVLSVVGGAATGAIAAAAAFDAVVAIIGGLMIGLGALMEYVPEMETFLDKGIEVLGKIGEGIGVFAGKLIGGLAEGVMSALPTIGLQLSTFMLGVQPFLAGASAIDPNIGSNVASLCEAIIVLAGTEFLTGITSLFDFGTDFDSLSETLVSFGEAMVAYSETVAGKIDSEAVSASASAGKMLVDLTNSLPSHGGKLQAWFGEKTDLETFGSQMASFGKCLVEYSNVITADGGIDSDAIEASASAGQLLSDLAGSLPSSGGVLQQWLGEKNLENFGAQLKAFGECFVSYSNAITADGGIDAEAVEKSASAAQMLSELADSLPSQDGVIQDWFGEKNLETFGSQLKAFGEALVGYSETVANNIDEDAIASSKTAGDTLSELASSLPSQGGTIKNWFSDTSMDTFSASLTTFGVALSDYSKSVSGVDTTKISESAGAASEIVALSKDLGDKGGLFSSQMTISDFGDKLDDFGESFASFSKKIDTVDTEKLSVSISQFETIMSLATDASNLDFTGLSTFGESMKMLGECGVSDFIDSFDDAQEKAESTGAAFVQKVVTGMKSLDSSYSTIGVNAAQGFIKGMTSMKSSVYSSGWSIGNAALTAAKKALGIHSPSKEFKYLGEHVGTGFKIGLDNTIGPTVKTVSAMMNKAIAVAKKGVEEFEDWADERNFYSELTTAEELAGWKQLQKMYKEGSEERKKIDRQVYTLENQIVKETFEYSKNWIENEEFYDRLTTERKLQLWKNVQARYMEGSDERKEADREVYTLEKELEDERYQDRLDHIDNEVFYGRMGLQEELVALAELQSEYEVNSEKWLELDKKIYSKREEVIQEFYDNLTSYIDNEKSYNRMGDVGELGTLISYMNSFERGSDQWKSIMDSTYDLVVSIGEAQIQYEEDIAAAEEEHAQKKLELEEEYADKVNEINQQMEEDIESLNQQYEDSVKSRADALYKSYGLFDEVSEKEEVSGDTLLKNLTDQVAEFEEWTTLMNSLGERGINDDMMEELEEMGPSAIASIRALSSMSDTELSAYVDLWAEKHRLAREQATNELEDLRSETDEKIEQIKTDTATELEEYQKVWQESMDELDSSLQESLESITESFHKEIGLISKYTEEEFATMADNVSKLMSEKGYNIGSNTIAGILAGFKENLPELSEAVSNIANGVISGVSDTLEIHSPSRVMYQLGLYTLQGYLNAFDAMSSTIFETGSDAADGLTGGFLDSLVTVADILDDGLVLEPTIRPVIDLSDVYLGVNDLNYLLSGNRSVYLADRLNTSIDKHNQVKVTVDNDEVVQAIRDLQSDMASMSDAISEMQVVMDTGSLVGSIINPIDSALGQRQIRRGRSN